MHEYLCSTTIVNLRYLSSTRETQDTIFYLFLFIFQLPRVFAASKAQSHWLWLGLGPLRLASRCTAKYLLHPLGCPFWRVFVVVALKRLKAKRLKAKPPTWTGVQPKGEWAVGGPSWDISDLLLRFLVEPLGKRVLPFEVEMA